MQRAAELQMQINDALSCLGQCAGCTLVPEERKSKAPDMPAETLKLAVERLEEHAASLAPVRRVNVIFGIGDHILYGSDYLAGLHRMGSRIVRAGRPLEPDRSVVFFTTSLVGKQDHVLSMLKEVRQRMEGDVQFVPQVVLDGRLMNATKFGPLWKTMVAEAKSMFGKVDLATNLSADAVMAMTPRQLLDFAEANCFDEISVTWSPTLHNAPKTLPGKDAIIDWLMEFDSMIDDRTDVQTTYRPVIAKLLSSFSRREDGQMPSMIETVDEIVPETVRHAFEIEPSGHIIPKFEAIGDVTHAPRHGLHAIGHIAQGPIADTIEKAIPSIKSRIVGLHARGACSSCDVAPVCAGTGFHVATHVARKMGRGSESGCPHLAYRLIRHVSERFAAEDASLTYS